jgi:hypothetical protein
MSKRAKKWRKHVDLVDDAPRFVVTPTTWRVHQVDVNPAQHGVTEVRICDVDGERLLQICQFDETISICEEEFEMVVQAGAAAFLQRWPK